MPDRNRRKLFNALGFLKNPYLKMQVDFMARSKLSLWTIMYNLINIRMLIYYTIMIHRRSFLSIIIL